MPDQSIKDVQANLSNMSTEELQVLLADVDEYPNRFVEHVGYDSAVEFCDAVILELLETVAAPVIPKPQKYTRAVRRAAKSKSRGSRKRGNFSVNKSVVGEIDGRFIAEAQYEDDEPAPRSVVRTILLIAVLSLALTLASHFF